MEKNWLWQLAGTAGRFWRHCLNQTPSSLDQKAGSVEKSRVKCHEHSRVTRNMQNYRSAFVPSDFSASFPLGLGHQCHGARNLERERASCSNCHNHCGSFCTPSWLSASFEPCTNKQTKTYHQRSSLHMKGPSVLQGPWWSRAEKRVGQVRKSPCTLGRWCCARNVWLSMTSCAV